MKQFSLLCYFLISALLLSAQSIPNDTVKTKRSLFKHKKHKQEAAYTPYCSSCEITQFDPETYFTDDDADGVYNVFDLQLNTPALAPVDSNGVAVDSDGDGVLDCFDNDGVLPIHTLSNKMMESIIRESGYPCKSILGSNYNEWILPVIFFDFNSNIPDSVSLDFLKRTAELLIHNPNLTIEIDGNYDYDVESSNLGIIRMYYVANFLIDEGVDSNKIRLKYDDFQNSGNKLLLHPNEKDLSVFYRALLLNIN